MTATAHIRGHRIHFDGEAWRFIDTGAPASNDRPCASCGLTADRGGPDPCVGWLDGYTSYCCGHGVEEPYGIQEDR